MIHKFPYPDFPPLEIPDDQIADVCALQNGPATADDLDIVRKALNAPVGCGRLRDEVEVGMRVTIAVDDNSRSTRTDLMLPLVLAELEDARIPARDVCVFIALGTHRRMTRGEMEAKYTPEVAAKYRFVNHDWKDPTPYVSIGQSSHGFPVKIHSEILNSDFLIGVGQTVPHMIAGFGGGGKIINPGCADADTIGEMHWLCNEVPAGRLFAVRDNVVREAIDEAAIKAGLKFIINEVPAGGGHLAGAFAGHPVAAHREACDLARSACEVRIREKADIVISDAYPADLDFWQALKGFNAACGAVRDGGTVILVTPCPEGTSAQHPELTAVGYIPVERTRRMVAEGTIDKAIAANLVLGRRLLDRTRAILVTKGISERDTRAMGFGWAPDPATALQQAIARHGRSATINVLNKAAAMICVSNTI